MTTAAWQLLPEDSAYRLTRVTREVPAPAAGQVKVRVRAVSLNYRDLVNRDNLAGRNVAGRVPTSDGAGEVIAVGPDVTEWRIGDRVAGCLFQTWQSGRFDMAYHKQDLGGTLDGMLAEEVLLSAGGVVRVPEHLSWAEAASLPCAAVTAWYSLTTRGGLQAGETVLVLGTGGVSIFGLQFATALGAKVIVTSSSDAKLERARALGAWQTVNYRTQPDWHKVVWELTGKQGVDHILEVGGPGTLEKSLGCIAAGGHIALIGVLTGFGAPQTSLFPLVARNARINGIYVGSRTDFEAMSSFIAERSLRPVIDREFPFDAAPEAFAWLKSGSHFGKVVIGVDG